jgi:putative heme-binding domain-containing protein
MSRLFSLFVLLLVTAASAFAQGTPTPAEPENFHLFLLAGQSNMAGRGEVDSDSQVVHPRIVMLDKRLNWKSATDPMHFDKPKIVGVGPGLSFAIEYAKKNPDVTVGLIPSAVGGSPIDAWEPGGYHTSTKSHPYDDMLPRLRSAMQAGQIKGILWHQGESDSKPGLSRTYETKLHQLIQRLRKEIGRDDVPFVVGQLGQFTERPWNAHKEKVDVAHRSLPMKVSHTAFVSSHGLEHKGDDVHFSSDAARELGRRYAVAYENLVAQKLAVEPVPGFELDDGDRVVFLGDALVEQEQYFGWIELMLTNAFADRDVTFRNLGWNADTPAGDSRFGLSLLQAGREPDDEGFKQLSKQIELTKPTVVVFGYGMASYLEGGLTGVDEFVDEFDKLIDKIKEVSPKVRFLFLSPIDRIDDQLQAETVARYSGAVKELAEQNDGVFLDLEGAAPTNAFRKDPIHLNDDGYRYAAALMQQQMGLPGDWQTSPHTESLRESILRKNVWWFHRSRPANMAYVFGFRKREQGQNAVEIPKFDELIAEEEERIAALRSLKPIALQQKSPRTKSNFAKFSEQPTPEFTTGKDLEVTLWAENPQLNKPIQMNFDPQGRLWVASSEAYPMIEVGQAAPDKILVLEDTNGDGKSDKSTVFADGLLIPTGVIPGDGGCYVAQSTDLLFLKDTDGDGKADVKKRVLSGFGTEDTHHNLHTLAWGPDSRLYMNQSVYTRTDTETPGGVVRLKAGGVFRYNPATMNMQVQYRGMWNPWGHQFDAHGQWFLTDGAGFAGIAYGFPGAVFFPTAGTKRLLDLISPGSYPKFCSAEIIYGDSYPPEWQGSLITCDFRANRVTRFSLAEKDAGFVAQQEDDLLRTSAASFRPIDVKQGPDGALYIADWSNPIINHGEVDFRDERRDRWHGRIWRVSWKGAKKKSIKNLTDLHSDDLFKNLTANDRYVRDQSRRVLTERKSKISDKVQGWTEKLTDEYALLQAVWLQQGLGTVDDAHLQKILEAKDPKIRAAAIRIVSSLIDHEKSVGVPGARAMKRLSRAINDSHPRVRLEAIRGLGKLDSSEAARVALTAMEHPRDRFIDFALGTTMEELADPFLAALNAGQWKPDSPQREAQLEFVLTNIDAGRAGDYLSKHLSENAITKDGSGPWIELIGKAGSKPEITRLFRQVTSDGFDDAASLRSLTALSDAQRLRKMRPEGNLGQITGLLKSDNGSVKDAAIRLIGNWKMKSQIDSLAKIAKQNNSSSAIEALRQIGPPATKTLSQLAGSKNLDMRKQAVLALASLNSKQAAELFFATLPKIKNEQQGTQFWREFLSYKNAGASLTSAFPSGGISELAARAGMRAAKDGGRNEPDLIAALMPHANLDATIEKLTPERIAMLVGKVESEGDAGRGESVYSRADLACINCHAIGGVGGKVGPDMTSLGASAPLDYLIESVYEPNAKIKENYHSVIVATEDGQTISGIEVEETDDELVIRDANNKLVRVPQDDIIAKKAGKSLMPNGVVDRLTLGEQVDLLKFLSQLGKPGDFDASKGGVGRVYEVLAGTHRIEQQGSDRIISGELQEGWQPLSARVNGDVPGETLTKMTVQPRNISLVNVYLRTKFSVASDGEFTFSTTGPDKSALWIDGERVEGETSFTTKLNAGTHTALLRLDGKALPKALRLLCRDVNFATEL